MPSGAANGACPPAVLTVENSLRENGGLRVSLGHALRFSRAGAPVCVAVIQNATGTALVRPDPGLHVDMLTRPNARLRWALLPAFGRLVARARRADVVLAGSEIGHCVLLGWLAARLTRRPFAVLVQAQLDAALHDWVPRPLHGPTRWMLRRVDAAICVTESLVVGLVTNGLPRDRVHVVVNGIDVADVRRRAGLSPDPIEPDPIEPDPIEPDPTRPGPDAGDPAPGHRNSPPVVVGNGRLTAAKNFPLLVRAHARVRAAGVDHRLVIMGEGPDRPEIEAVIEEAGVGGTVTLTGFQTEPYGRLATADLFVLSSDTEGLPLTVLEALAVGTPVVATRCGTGPDLLLDSGRYGELVPVGDLDALAAAIESHLRDPAPLLARAGGGPRRALEFDAGHSAAGVMAVLAGLTPNPTCRERG